MAVAAAPISPPPSRSFVPAGVDVADFSQLEPLYLALLERNLDTRDALERWLNDFAELTAVVDEYGCPPVRRDDLPHRRQGR